MSSSYLPRALILGLTGIAVPVVCILLVGVWLSVGKTSYELLRDLFVPLVGPLVAVLIPLLLFFVIPSGQNREKTALALCQQYYAEEMRDARNAGWRHLVIELRRATDAEKAERQREFFRYLTSPDEHGAIDPRRDEVFQKLTRVLDFFGLVNEVLARGSADEHLVRSFLLYYYLWWRDEIMDPLRACGPIGTNDAKFKPVWWDRLTHLDALAGR
jgi:hypothetical protein